MKHYLVLFIFLFFVNSLFAQTTFDDFKKEADARFTAFKEKKDKEFQSFRDKQNAKFAEFLRQKWNLFDGEKPQPKPKDEEITPNPPVVISEEDNKKPIEENLIPIKIVVKPLPTPKPPKPLEEPIELKPVPQEKKLLISFYGTDLYFRCNKSIMPILSLTTEDGVADFWEELSDVANNLLKDCIENRNEYNLCDWAYYQMTKMLANNIYGDSDANVVLHAFLLNQTGFQIRLARNNNNNICLLTATDADVYGYPYWYIDATRFYCLDCKDYYQLSISNNAFPQELPLRLTIQNKILFDKIFSESRTLQSERYDFLKITSYVNKNLIDFYNEYPTFCIGDDFMTRWRAYAIAPLSDEIINNVYSDLRRFLNGKNTLDAVEFLLNFVQTAFTYEYDSKVWGKDRAFFPEETLFYPYCDCEDRSILFSRLVKDLLGLRVALVYYPGHLATAVNFPTEVKGDFFMVDGLRFTICDPTFIGAGVGRSMPNLDDSNIKFIEL